MVTLRHYWIKESIQLYLRAHVLAIYTPTIQSNCVVILHMMSLFHSLFLYFMDGVWKSRAPSENTDWSMNQNLCQVKAAPSLGLITYLADIMLGYLSEIGAGCSLCY